MFVERLYERKKRVYPFVSNQKRYKYGEQITTRVGAGAIPQESIAPFILYGF